jgi:hypothetical protein
VAEPPEQSHERAAGALRMPPVDEWDTFDGGLRPRALLPPVEREQPRRGVAGGDWPGGLPVVVLPPTPEDAWQANLHAVARAPARG